MRTDSTGVKLGVAFGFLIVLLISVSWLALTRTRQIDTGSNEALTVALVLAAITVAIGIAVDVTLQLSRDSEAREQDRLEIRKLNEELERKAAERGEDLARTVETLKGEVFERRAREGDQRRLAAIVENMEDALRRSEASFRSLVQHAPYGILRTTSDGRIMQANPALVEMLGYSSEEEVLNLHMGKDIYLNPSEREEVMQWCETRDSIQGIEVEWKHKSGRPFTIRCASHLVRDSEGKVEYMEGFVEDISERRAMEQQLRQAQKMEAIGRLAGGIAHDFNNLLGVIIGYGDLVLEKAGETSPLRTPVEQIRKAADRASSLTRQLLAFSRQQMLEVKVLDLNAVVTEMGKMLPRLLGEDIQLETSLDPTLGKVKADEGQIEQVVMNLAVNARDAMPTGGRLLIHTANVSSADEFDLEQPPIAPGKYVMLLVKDSGMGMDAETRAHIFEPFFTTKEQGKGTGLGLATVYGFVKQSGGYIWVSSEPGAGTTFTIYLPQVQGEVAKHPLSHVDPASHRGAETILLVEDEHSLRTLTQNILEESGYTVLEASNGAEAIDQARKYPGPIHLLLTDMVMPGISGQAVAAKLAVMRRGIHVLYMSGYTGFEIHGLADLETSVIRKPFTRDVLLNKLREALDFAEKTGRR